jgi:hypothetical protein
VFKGEHPISTVVAVEATLAIVDLMLGDEFRFVVAVTVEAIDALGCKLVVDVAVVANEGIIAEILDVQGDTEAGEFAVVDVGEGDLADDSIASAVFDMAGLAASGPGKNPMEANSVLALFGDIEVAFLAAVGGNAVKGRMAVAAFLFEFGVGCIAVDLCAGRSRIRDWAGAMERFQTVRADGHAQCHHAYHRQQTKERMSD